MTVTPEESVFRRLPAPYRKAGKETAAFALARAAGLSLDGLERLSRQVLQAHYIDHLGDLDDAERLAALFELAPWPEEDLAEFRFRVKLVARIYLEGAATSRQMLQMIGAASDSELTEVTGPERESNDRYTTAGKFQRRVAHEATFSASVVDDPLVLQEVVVEPPSGFVWTVTNNSYDDPGGLDPDGKVIAPTYPEPIVDIVAGDHPVAVPILTQRDRRRLVLINRFIPPGATLRVDLRTLTISDIAGPATLEGPVRYNGEAVPLLFGTGGLVDQPEEGRLTDPGVGPEKARPFHLVRWNKVAWQGEAIPAVPGAPGSTNPVPLMKMPWPPLLGFGLSHWRLLAGVTPQNQVPALDEILTHLAVRPIPCTGARAPAKLTFRWIGRRLGTFTLIFSEQQLRDGPVPGQPMPHRVAWLRQQVERLKLAGVIYIEQALAKATLPAGAVEPPTLALWDMAPAGDGASQSIQHVSRSVPFAETTVLGDAVAVSVTKEA